MLNVRRMPREDASVKDRCLAAITSAIEYLHDRGEMDEDMLDVGIYGSHTRYTREATDRAIYAYGGKIIEVTAREIGSYEVKNGIEIADDGEELWFDDTEVTLYPGEV